MAIDSERKRRAERGTGTSPAEPKARQSLLFAPVYNTQDVLEPKGAVFTRDWVVDLILDLAGYAETKNLADAIAVEPAAGEGAFLIRMARRLLTSCRNRKRPLEDCAASLIAYDLNDCSARAAQRAVSSALTEMGVCAKTAEDLASGWIKTGDYLFESLNLPKADFVIGNPPYVRLEDIPEEAAHFYRRAYPTMIGRADLYVAFHEAGLRQLKDEGVCAFICADRWMLNQYGGELRRLITSSFSVDAVVEMHNADAFHDDVSAYPAITVIRKGPQRSALVARLDPVAGSKDCENLAAALLEVQSTRNLQSAKAGTAKIETWFSGSDPWPCGSPRRLALLRRLEERFAPLESVERSTRVGIGVATGCDEVFITKDPALVEESRLVPLALARDTVSGEVQWSGHYLVDPWNGAGLVDLEQYPRLQRYLHKHADLIKRRNTAQKNPRGWYRTIDRVNHALTNAEKLYVPDIKNVFNPVLDRGQTYPHHNLYFIESKTWDLEVLGGILLSAVGQFFIECYGVRMRGGYLRFQAQYLRRIRLPDPRGIADIQQAGLAEAFRNRDRDLATAIALDLYSIEKLELNDAIGS